MFDTLDAGENHLDRRMRERELQRRRLSPEMIGLFEKEGRCRPASPLAAPAAWSITPSTSSISTTSICAQHRLLMLWRLS